MEEESNNKFGSFVAICINTIIQSLLIILKLCKIKPIENWNWSIIVIPTIATCFYFTYTYICKLCKLCKKKEINVDNVTEKLVDLSETESC